MVRIVPQDSLIFCLFSSPPSAAVKAARSVGQEARGSPALPRQKRGRFRETRTEGGKASLPRSSAVCVCVLSLKRNVKTSRGPPAVTLSVGPSAAASCSPLRPGGRLLDTGRLRLKW